MSTGQLFFAAGAAGMIATAILALVSIRLLRKEKKELQEQIWKEYK